MEYVWIGSRQPMLDEICIKSVGKIHVGCYGGSTNNGAYKNEDAVYCLQAIDNQWVFSVLLDAHHSSDSAKLIINLLKNKKDELVRICNSDTVFSDIEPYIIGILSEESFRSQCESINGETSCLFCFQSGAYIWWLSIGDCMAFLFHPELAKFNQYGLNQRQFFEWIGQNNTFSLPVPCYSSGRRQLRQGTNYIILMTDGLLEYEKGKYQSPINLYHCFVNGNQVDQNLNMLLQDIMMNGQVRDSTSVICWEVINMQPVLCPSD